MYKSNYIYQELDGHLTNKPGLNFTLFIKSFIGIILYGIDSNGDKCLIEAEQENGTKVIIIKYKQSNNTINIYSVCGCNNCSNIFITFIMQLYNDDIIILCNNINTTITFDNQINTTNLFQNYPIPINHNKTNNKTYIWIGNIGPYYNDKASIYSPLKNQLIGCIDQLYFNNKLIIINNNYTNQFIGSCSNENHTKMIKMPNCEIPNEIYYTNLSFINEIFHEKEMIKYNEQTNKYQLKETDQTNISISIQWIDEFINKYNCTCLLQIIFNKNITMSIKLDSLKNIILSVMESEKIICERSFTILSNQTNYLSISFFYPNIRIQISNGNTLVYYNDILAYKLLFVQFGICNDTNYCDNTNAKMNYKYFISKNYDKERFNIWKLITNNTKFLISTILIIICILFILIVEINYFKRGKTFRRKEEIFNNKYKLQYQCIPLPPINDNIDTNNTNESFDYLIMNLENSFTNSPCNTEIFRNESNSLSNNKNNLIYDYIWNSPDCVDILYENIIKNHFNTNTETLTDQTYTNLNVSKNIFDNFLPSFESNEKYKIIKSFKNDEKIVQENFNKMMNNRNNRNTITDFGDINCCDDILFSTWKNIDEYCTLLSKYQDHGIYEKLYSTQSIYNNIITNCSNTTIFDINISKQNEEYMKINVINCNINTDYDYLNYNLPIEEDCNSRTNSKMSNYYIDNNNDQIILSQYDIISTNFNNINSVYEYLIKSGQSGYENNELSNVVGNNNHNRSTNSQFNEIVTLSINESSLNYNNIVRNVQNISVNYDRRDSSNSSDEGYEQMIFP